MRRSTIAAILFAAASGCLIGTGLAALAAEGPVTYAGTLGNSAIVVEFTSDPARPGRGFAGRYFYRNRGIDIPLQPRTGAAGRIVLAEEEPCDAAACPEGGPGPLGATLTLSAADGGRRLTGDWKGARSFPVTLERVGTRPAPADAAPGPLGLFQFSEELPFAGPVSAATSPYDALRLEFSPASGPVRQEAGATWRMQRDPRTVFDYPNLLSLPGGAPVDRANAVLSTRRDGWSLAALTCAGLAYAGFTDPGAWRGPGGGDLGGIDDLTVTVDYVSPRLMSWTESGSIFCGGAHPDNSTNSFLLDIERGELLTMSDLFRDWSSGRPSPDLVELVRERRPMPNDDIGREFEAECGMDELIAEYLSARLGRAADGSTRIVFGLEGLPHAINACAENLFEVPVDAVRQYLTPHARALLAD